MCRAFRRLGTRPSRSGKAATLPAAGSGVGLVCLPARGGGGTAVPGCVVLMEILCAAAVGGVRAVPSTITPVRPPRVSGRKVKKG